MYVPFQVTYMFVNQSNYFIEAIASCGGQLWKIINGQLFSKQCFEGIWNYVYVWVSMLQWFSCGSYKSYSTLMCFLVPKLLLGIFSTMAWERKAARINCSGWLAGWAKWVRCQSNKRRIFVSKQVTPTKHNNKDNYVVARSSIHSSSVVHVQDAFFSTRMYVAVQVDAHLPPRRCRSTSLVRIAQRRLPRNSTTGPFNFQIRRAQFHHRPL